MPRCVGSWKPVSWSRLTSARGAPERPGPERAQADSAPAATNAHGFRRMAVRVSALTLVAQVIGFGSSVAIAQILGASRATDAYYLGLSVPMLVYGIFLTSARQCGIPTLTEESSRSRSAFVDASSQLISATLVVSTIISAAAAAVAIGVLPLTGSHALVSMARVKIVELAPLGVLGAMIGAMACVLAVRNRFAVAALVLGIDPLLRIVLLVATGKALGTDALVIANLAGNAAAVLVMWGLIRHEGIPLSLRSPLRSPFVRRVLAIGAPLVLSTSILQVNPVIDRGMAGGLGSGTITALELGLRLFGVPMLLVGATLIGPVIATWSARKATFGWPALRDSVNRATDIFAVITPPVMVIGIALRHQIVDAMYQGGAYSVHATNETATVFAMLMLGLPASLLTLAFSTLFVIEKQPKFCLQAGMANVVLNVVLNFALRPVWGVGGIALSTSVTLSILLAAYVVTARRRWQGISIPFASAVGARSLASGVLTALLAYGLVSLAPAATDRLTELLEIGVVASAVLVAHAALVLATNDRTSALRSWVADFRLGSSVPAREHQGGS